MSRQIDFIIADLDRHTEKTVVGIALNAQANLQQMTPRDTGWARANWVPSVSTPSIFDASPEARPSSGEVAAARSRAEAGAASVLGYKLTDGSVFTTNNVPYIQQLNEGTSQQADAGFVLVAVERAVHESRFA